MPLCVCPSGSGDSSNRSDVTRQPDPDGSASQQEKSQKDTENMDLQGSMEESSTDAPVSHEAH